MDWKKIKANKAIKFCYIKATEGKSFRDPMCRKHAKRAHENGLLVGLYHYFRTDVSAQQQFENFKRVYDSVPSELIPVIDVEENGNNFRNTSNLNDKLERLIALFEREYGQKNHYLPRLLLLPEGNPHGLCLPHLVALPKGLPLYSEHRHQANRRN